MITKKNVELLLWEEKDTISKLKMSLMDDNISIVSADTILGLLGSLTQESFDKLNSIKGRGFDKNYLIVVESLQKALKFVQGETISDAVAHMLVHCWPGKITIIFKVNSSVPSFMCSNA